MTNYDDDELITAIINFMEENKPDFDLTFVMSLYEAKQKWGKLTPKQRSSLENIARGFKIDVSEWAS